VCGWVGVGTWMRLELCRKAVALPSLTIHKQVGDAGEVLHGTIVAFRVNQYQAEEPVDLVYFLQL